MAKRSKNAAATTRRGGSSRAASKRSSAKAAPVREPVVDSLAINDISGVLVAVLAAIMVVSLISPSTAVVTHAIGRVLVLGFGAGAMLVPIALFAFSVTFFVSSDRPLSARVALGLGLVVLAVLSMLSLVVSGAEADPEMVLKSPALEGSGGYVGGAIAWMLLTLMGRTVGMVILFGIIIAGIIICGFSISDLVARIQSKATELADAAAIRREERARARELASPAMAEDDYGWAEGADAWGGAPATSFIGDRIRSVIRREEPEEEVFEHAATTLLDHDVEAEQDYIPEPVPVNDEVPFDVIGGGSGAIDDDADDGEAVPEFMEKTRRIAKKPKKKAPKAASGALPPVSMIKSSGASGTASASKGELAATAQRLQATLEEFGLASKVTGWVSGPAVTTFKISMGEGERVNKITNLQDDIALSLAAKSVRIFAPIPGTSLVGIEIPNKEKADVYLGDVLPYVTGGPLEAAFGRDSEGKPVVVDLAGLPHLLVAGTTGSGKSVLLNSIVMSMLMRATPEQVRLIMVDPKRVEFTYYEGLPHLYVPVVTEARQAASALQWGVSEMERRLKVFERHKVRDIKSFNNLVDSGRLDGELGEDAPTKMPYFVIVIDELADLMMVAGKDVEASIVRIAQLGRAAGIHLIVATQRPSADVVTGLIKANIDNRVALSVDNGMNSRIILDQTGAERLLGKGDMLYKLRGRRPQRAQACFVSEEEVGEVVSFIREHHEADYHEDILSLVAGNGSANGAAGDQFEEEDDPLVWEAARIVVDSQLGSTSGLQRRLKVGYARAGRIMDNLEQKGIVGPPDGSKPREVLVDADGLEELRAAEAQYREVE